jgi:uncharacterized protein
MFFFLRDPRIALFWLVFFPRLANSGKLFASLTVAIATPRSSGARDIRDVSSSFVQSWRRSRPLTLAKRNWPPDIEAVITKGDPRMTPEERQLITGLFDRMRNVAPQEKDREAEALINQSVRAMSDAPYMLVQSVLVQDQALQQADARIRELEERVRALDQPARTGSGGSFLGGLFGGGRSSEPQTRTTSVPPIGSRPAPVSGGPQTWGQPSAGQPWGQPTAGQPWGQPTAGMAPPQAAPRAGGGFLQSAISTAAGVAGGVLLADSIRGMMHGGSPFGASAAEAHQRHEDTQAHDVADTQHEQYQDPSDNDPGTGTDPNDPGTDANVQDASYEDSGSDSGDSSDDGGDWGGGDTET